MLKSSRKKGLCIIEVLCALTILCTLLSYLFNIQIKNLYLKQNNNEINKYVELSENLKNNLKYNYSYKGIESLFLKNNSTNKLYVNRENLNIHTMNSQNIDTIIDLNKPKEVPYAEMRLEHKEQGVIKILINIKMKSNGEGEDIRSYFYKGDY